MKRIALYLTALLVVASACNNKQTVRDEDDADDLEFRVVSYTSPDSTFTYEIEAPVEGGTMLADSILNYIWESLGTEFRDRYNGDNIEEAILSGASGLYEARQQEIESFREDIDGRTRPASRSMSRPTSLSPSYTTATSTLAVPTA